MVIGGGQIYAQAMPHGGPPLYQSCGTRPGRRRDVSGHLPEEWRIVEQPIVEPSPKDEASFLVRVYERVPARAH